MLHARHIGFGYFDTLLDLGVERPGHRKQSGDKHQGQNS